MLLILLIDLTHGKGMNIPLLFTVKTSFWMKKSGTKNDSIFKKYTKYNYIKQMTKNDKKKAKGKQKL